MRIFIILSILTLYILNCTSVNAAQNDSIYSHEYNYVSICMQDPNCYPIVITMMMEPRDTLTLNMQNASSVINSINNRFLLEDSFKNENKYLQLYGNKQYVLEDVWTSNSEFGHNWENLRKVKKYKLCNGGDVEISFMKVDGLFLKYRLYDNVDLVELYGERANTFEMICPLHIVQFEACDNINLIAK